MSRRHKRSKQATLERAQQQQYQGGTVIPNALIQQFMAQIAAQSKQQQGQNAFSPGKPLDPQNVNPGGLPIAFRYPVAYNVSGLDRSLGNPEIPPFQQLRNLADLYEGIQLCEKVWLDLIPRLQLKITLRPELVTDTNTDDNFQKEIAQYQSFFERPDGINDLHSWLRIAITEQLQLDALYIHKQKIRGGQLQALNIVAGDTMKVLLDDWGRVMGYQQFPWGIPGEIFTPDQMLYFRESPRANTPYGKSRVERILMRVNQALRKEKKDLAHFTEGNQPFAMMEVPESSQWTPDQIEAFEAMWNSLIAGNVQQQVRVKFTQPGMKYTPLEQYQLLSDFDQFILNIATAAYGISLADLSFTGDIHKSSDDGQQNMLGRRTIYPLVGMYGMLLTSVIRDDFKDSRFIATFAGFEEAEDVNSMVGAYSQAAQAGLIGITDATNALKFPQPKDAPYIGRVMLTKDGPIFLDDMASSELRDAAVKAKMAGFQMATKPPEPQTQQKQPGEEQQADNAPLARYNQVHDKHGRFGSSDGGSRSSDSGDFVSMSLSDKETFLAANGGTAWERSLTPQQKTAIANYADNDYEAMNNALRTGNYQQPPQIWYKTADQLQAQIADCQAGLLKGQSPTKLVVSRGYGNSQLAAFQQAAAQGGSFVEKGFCSTTIMDNPGQRFTDGFQVNIHIPKGSPGGYVSPFSYRPDEREWILPHGSLFNVANGSQDASGKWTFNVFFAGVR